MTRNALGIVLIVLLAQAAAWGAVSVSWTDSAGYHNVPLSIAWNPEYDGKPYSLEQKYAWQGAIGMVLDTMGPIQLTIQGNFFGGDGFDYAIWRQVRIEQTVLNNTGRGWSGFYLETANLVPDPNTSRNPTFYTVFQWDPVDWDAYILPGGMELQYEAYDPEDPIVGPGDSFFDVVKVNSDYDPTTGDGGFYLYKRAVPEPASLAALAGCLAGMIVYVKRRKA